MLVVVFSISYPDALEAPVICCFNGVPLFDRLVDALHQVEKEVSVEVLATRLKGYGLTDKVLTKMSLMLTKAKTAGEWPSIENRLEDGSLMAWQLLTFHDVMTVQQKIALDLRRRQAKKN